MLAWYRDFRWYEMLAERLHCSVFEVERRVAEGHRLIEWAAGALSAESQARELTKKPEENTHPESE